MPLHTCTRCQRQYDHDQQWMLCPHPMRRSTLQYLLWWPRLHGKSTMRALLQRYDTLRDQAARVDLSTAEGRDQWVALHQQLLDVSREIFNVQA